MTSCPNCGKSFETVPKFCPDCGTPQPVPGGPTMTPGAGQETIIGVIGGLDFKRSFLRSETVNLVITDTRIFCVPVASLMEAAIQRAVDEAKAQGKGFIGTFQAKAEVTKAANFAADFRSLAPDDIVRKFPAAIVIPHTDLVSISIRHRNLDFEGEDISNSAEDWPVAIRTKNTEYSLVARVDPVRQFKSDPAVDALLGDRIKILF